LNGALIPIPLPHDSYYRGSIEALNTKIGLSSGAVTVLSSLLDELPNFRRRVLEMIGVFQKTEALAEI
jgi:hypothetical protein